MSNRRDFANVLVVGGASSILPKPYYEDSRYQIDSVDTEFKLLPDLHQIIKNCGSESYKIAIPAQEYFVKVIKQPLQDTIDRETDIEKHDDINKMSDNFFNDLDDIGAMVELPSEDFTNLRYDKIDEMLVDFKNQICQRLKDHKILFYGDIKIWCDEHVHRHKQVGIYGWCDGTAINPLARTEDQFNQILQSRQRV